MSGCFLLFFFRDKTSGSMLLPYGRSYLHQHFLVFHLLSIIQSLLLRPPFSVIRSLAICNWNLVFVRKLNVWQEKYSLEKAMCVSCSFFYTDERILLKYSLGEGGFDLSFAWSWVIHVAMEKWFRSLLTIW